MRITRKLANNIANKEVLTLAKSVNPNMRSVSVVNPQKRKESGVTAEQLESLLILDSLTFRIVQKYKEKMFGSEFTLKGGTKETRNICSKFIDNVHLIDVCATAVQDIFVAGKGEAWIELGYTDSGDDIIGLRVINPKSGITFETDEDGNVTYDDSLRPTGIVIPGTHGYPRIEWHKDSITIDGSVVWKAGTNEDGRDRIAHFTLIDLGENEKGLSPLEPGYKAALIRMNLEDSSGNAGFRGSAIAAYVGGVTEDPMSIPDALLDDVKNKLMNVDQDTVWAFRRNVELKSFPTPEIDNYSKLLYYFADLQSSGSGIGIALILEPMDRGYRGDIEIAKQEFLDTIQLYQNKIAKQIREQIFKRLLKARGKNPDSAPYIIFRNREASIGLSTARRLSTYARYGLLIPDLELENWIRDLEGLPRAVRPIDSENG